MARTTFAQRRLISARASPASPCFQLRVERVVAREHVVDLGDREIPRRPCRAGNPPARAPDPAGNAASACRTRSGRRTAHDAEARVRFARRIVAAGKRVRISLNAARDPAPRCDRGSACGSRACAPVGVSRGDEVGLRAQDDAVVEDLQRVGGERRAGGGDVDDQSAAPAAGAPSVAPRLSTMR